MGAFKVLNLFCGGGGLAEGFRQAGFDIVCGVEIEKDYCATFKHNHPGAVVIQGDLHELEPDEVLERCGCSRDEIDVVIGGPPCKGFSMAGKRWAPKNWREDERNLLVFRFAKYVDYIQPRMSLMENVLGMLSMANGLVTSELMKRFREAGYYAHHKVLNAADYGDPQIRKRVIFLGRRDGKPPVFPEPTHTKDPKQARLITPWKNPKPWVTVKEALLGVDFSKFPNHEVANHKKFMIERMEKLKPGKSLYDSYSESWYRLVLDEPAPTVKENHNAPFVHPIDPRVLTVRECATLQGFPLDYEFKGCKSIQLKQVGNAVPVNLSRALAAKIKEQMEDMEKVS